MLQLIKRLEISNQSIIFSFGAWTIGFPTQFFIGPTALSFGEVINATRPPNPTFLSAVGLFFRDSDFHVPGPLTPDFCS